MNIALLLTSALLLISVFLRIRFAYLQLILTAKTQPVAVDPQRSTILNLL